MTDLVKVFAVSAFFLLRPAVALSSSSLNDETCLVQVNQVVSQRTERPGKSKSLEMLSGTSSKEALAKMDAVAQQDEHAKGGDPFDDLMAPGDFEPSLDGFIADNDAIIDAEDGKVGDGSVTSAWEANLNKAKARVVAAVDDDIDFKQKVTDKRVADNLATAQRIAADRDIEAQAYAARNAKVAAAWGNRIDAQNTAVAEVAEAGDAYTAAVVERDDEVDVAEMAPDAVDAAVGAPDVAVDAAVAAVDARNDVAVDAAVAARDAAVDAAVDAADARNGLAVDAAVAAGDSLADGSLRPLKAALDAAAAA
jgi:hypothetical protein